jgi:hypothetical protein
VIPLRLQAGIDVAKNREETDDEGRRGQCFADYWMENDGGNDRIQPPEYNRELGLAVEKLPDGLDLNSLWQIII